MPETDEAHAPGQPAPEVTASAAAVEEVTVSHTGTNPDVEPSPTADPPVSDTRGASAKKAAPKRVREPMKPEFLAEQRILLLEERVSYTKQAEELKAEADSLALEHEPGDVQFDEEGGEGGTSNVDRELDLVLSAQARAAVVEIDRALAKIETGHYGLCEQCGQPIPHARLKALPYAALCVGCKSGGLSRR
jgi:RNA polymerase-binding transcription factor